jgi:hypothetical protein
MTDSWVVKVVQSDEELFRTAMTACQGRTARKDYQDRTAIT